MSLSNSVLHRYTPPTCTLEIAAPTSSPLSRGVGRLATNLLSFQLRFDDPRLPEEERVTIQGDHYQLEALHEAVKTYVQDLLNQSLERFKAMVCAPAIPSLDAPSSTNYNLDALKPPTSSRQIFLQPGGGLAHEIFLGPLATKESGPIIHLSVLQLFDLVTALDEHAADIVALSEPGRSQSAPSPRAWFGIAALLLLAVGLITAVVQFLNWQNPQKQIATTTVPEEASSKNSPQVQKQPLAQPSVSIPPSSLQRAPIPKPSTPIPSISSSEKLPLMPPLLSTVPSPSSSLPSVISPPTTTLKSAPPVIALPRTATVPNDQQLILPPAPPSSFTSRLTPPPPIAIPSPRQDQSAFIPGETAVPGVSSNRLQSKAPHRPTVSSNLPILTPANPDLEVPSVATPGAAAGASSRDSATQAYLPGTHLRNINPFKDGVSVPGTQKQPRSTTNTPNQPKSTVFDTIPQVAEVRDYFKQHWTPPLKLNPNPGVQPSTGS